MKRGTMYLFIFLIPIGLILSYSGLVLADYNEDGESSESESSGRSDSGRNSGSSLYSSSSNDSEDSDDDANDNPSTEDSDDEEETRETNDGKREGELRKKTREKDNKIRIKEKKNFFDENGNKIVVITETRTKDGETRIITKRKITDPNGVEITFKTKTKIEEGRERITNSIEFKGAEVTTNLFVREETRGGIQRFKAKLSTGAEEDIIIMPDEALRIAFEEIKTSNNFTFELTELVEGDTLKAAFSAKATKPGKLLGIFNKQVNLETLIDTETGKIIKTKRPWWSFLVVGPNESTICHVPEDDVNKRRTLNVAIPSVKAHLNHGDSVGACIAECGDGILVEDQELCDDGNNISGDGCDNVCEIEPIKETPTNNETA